ncbi:HAD family hydrolase [Curtobacterium sp. PhB146]|uniref:HAD family hydrolase n=1 Tax=Curtobacterium sp. PhB146 TaxID=2485187 RepID=UPI001053A925|nr:HAD family hydrolase [Curtobacterium sp. PhB146]TCU45486.1 putative hydrolase of the HAD superfamily [Curtobacterium sp. PhB146]
MAHLRAVGFDLDGTLFDHRGAATAGAARFLESLGVHASAFAIGRWFAAETEQFERWRTGQISFPEQRRERLRAVLPALGVPIPADDGGLDELFDAYRHQYEASWRAYPGSLPLLRTLRVQGYRIGVLTNGTETQQVDKLRRTGLLDAVDVVCTSERIGVQKPDRRAFETLSAEFGVEPSGCLFVGDSVAHDVEAAWAAGMHGLLIDHEATDGPDMETLVLTALADRRG